MNEIATEFIRQSRKLLQAEYLPKIAHCLEVLPPADFWWKPNPNSNSAGNLVPHLAGNVGQWLIAGVGGAPDTRERQQEFEISGGVDAPTALARLRAVMAEADRILAGLSSETLSQSRTIQGVSVTVLEAVYHVVEHFSTHMGQLIYITKLRTGQDLRFYTCNEDGTVQVWPGHSGRSGQASRRS